MKTKTVILVLILLLLVSFGCVQPPADVPLIPGNTEEDDTRGTTVDEGDTGGVEMQEYWEEYTRYV